MRRPLKVNFRSEVWLWNLLLEGGGGKRSLQNAIDILPPWKGDDVVLRHSHVTTLSLVTCSISLSTNLAGVPGYSRTLAQFSFCLYFSCGRPHRVHLQLRYCPLHPAAFAAALYFVSTLFGFR